MMVDSVPVGRGLARLGDWISEERALPGPPWPLNAVLLTIATVAPVPLTALALEEVTPLFWLILVADLVLLFGLAVATFRTPALFIAVMLLWFALQRFVVALIAPHVSADLVRLLLTYKEGFYLILVASGVVSVAMRQLRGERALPALLAADFVAVAFLGWLALVFISDPHSSSPELTYLRRFAAPVLLYVGGRLLIGRSEQLLDSVRMLVAVAVAVAAFGLVERFALDVVFWRDTVDASTFYGKQVESGLLPQNWTVIYRGVPDGIFIALPLEVPVRRLVSTYLEPTTLSSLLALALLLLVFVPDLAWRRAGPGPRFVIAAGVLALGIAVVATLSRGGMVTFVAATAFVLAVRWLRDPGWKLSVPLPFLLVPLLAFTCFGAALTTFDDVPARESVRDVLSTRAVSGLAEGPAVSSTAPPPVDTGGALGEIDTHPPGSTAEAASKHLRGLTTGLEEMFESPLGRGLGASGNWSREPGAGAESTVGVIAAQTGIVGFVLYGGFFAAVIASLVAAAWRRSGLAADLPVVLAGAMFGLFLVSWVSESASGLLGNAFYLLFAGWALALASPAAETFRWRWLPDVKPLDPLDAPASPTHTKV
ncbi:MAG TPA: hypothetical protein VGR43_10165 [Dehalococcoidia bacterium]|jgi:hypothetical protein|nr:hypothetical protein [Dehalococcoidia bacterium]